MHQCQISALLCLSQSGLNWRWLRRTSNHKKARLKFVKINIAKSNELMGEYLWVRWDQSRVFFFFLATSFNSSVLMDPNIKCIKKEHCTYSKTWRVLGSVLELLCSIWHRVSSVCAVYKKISRLSFGVKCAAHCQNGLSCRSWVLHLKIINT